MDSSVRVGETVLVSAEDKLLKAAVRHCEKDGDGYRLGLYLVIKEKRRLDRIVVAGSGQLNYQAEDGSEQGMPVEIHNVSEDGFRGTTPEAVPVGATVRLTGEQYECLATARYCNPEDGHFSAGFQYFVKPHLREKRSQKENPAATRKSELVT